MSLINITAGDFTKIARLVEQKEKYLAQVAEIDAQLSGMDVGTPVSATNGATRAKAQPTQRRKSRKRGRRGSTKEAIIAHLQAAAPSGLHMKDIAAKLKATRGSVSVWFQTTGKKIQEIKKIAPATFAWSGK